MSYGFKISFRGEEEEERAERKFVLFVFLCVGVVTLSFRNYFVRKEIPRRYEGEISLERSLCKFIN